MLSFFKNKKAPIDEQGQPVCNFNNNALTDRHIDELIGICKGLVADGQIVSSEATYLSDWLNTHRNYINIYPYNILYGRLAEMLNDNILDSDEASELLDIIQQMTGENKTYIQGHNKSTSLPLDIPEPSVDVLNSSFVFTGIFTIGTRLKCEEIVVSLGGEIHKTVTKKTNYLVIGDIGSEHWAHSTHGRKIEQAIKAKEKGSAIQIISEHNFIKYI